MSVQRRTFSPNEHERILWERGYHDIINRLVAFDCFLVRRFNIIRVPRNILRNYIAPDTYVLVWYFIIVYYTDPSFRWQILVSHGLDALYTIVRA